MKNVTLSKRTSEVSRTNKMVKISVLGVLSFIAMLFSFAIPIFPGFLKMDLGNVPSLLGAFALGPVAGVLIELVKNILHLVIRGTQTAGVGELSNFLIGGTFAFTAGAVYQIKKDKKHAIIGMILGTIVMSTAGVLTNLYLIIPFYSKAMGIPLEAVVGMGTAVNSSIIDLKTLIIFGVTPFNILKGITISFVVSMIYKKVSPIIQR